MQIFDLFDNLYAAKSGTQGPNLSYRPLHSGNRPPFMGSKAPGLTGGPALVWGTWSSWKSLQCSINNY